jgi:hypothetical protein
LIMQRSFITACCCPVGHLPGIGRAVCTDASP